MDVEPVLPKGLCAAGGSVNDTNDSGHRRPLAPKSQCGVTDRTPGRDDVLHEQYDPVTGALAFCKSTGAKCLASLRTNSMGRLAMLLSMVAKLRAHRQAQARRVGPSDSGSAEPSA